jgi:signal transduction histidine kinase
MSIRFKFIIGLTLAFALLFLAINFFMLTNARLTDEKNITGDLNSIEKNGQFYVKQDLLVNNETISTDSFSAEAENIVGDLGKSANIFFAAYSLDGKLIAANNQTVFERIPDSDLLIAKGGKTAYTIKTMDGKTTAVFSFPVTLNGQTIGILRCINDYTAVYRQSEKSLQLINMITLAGFLVSLLFAGILSRSVITPIRRLCLNLKNTAGDIQKNQIDPTKIRNQVKLTRRDELGDLSRSITDLIDKISQQMAMINSDRDELSRVSEYRRDFYNIVTHELKTPLTSIKGYAEVVRDNGFTDPDFFNTAMARIIEESDRLHEMVISLLEESKLGSSVEMPFERVNTAEIVANVCDSMRYKADKYGREIRVLPMPDAWVLGNPQSLKELMINLLDNAVKYASKNDIEVSIRCESEQVFLEIQNSADLLSQEEADQLFIPYHRNRDTAATGENGSIGLGLSICRQIVEKHKGNIRLTVSNAGKLTATVTLPAYRGL